ncbi:MAG TPA: hypothetical protein VFY29_05225 [Terriglobia bacterium]|nr:hypothetical protein [Terriglobia bacterium]
MGFRRFAAPTALVTFLTMVSGSAQQSGETMANRIRKDFDADDARSRHTNADYAERVTEDELKESAIFMATFAWQAASSNEKIPRAPAR